MKVARRPWKRKDNHEMAYDPSKLGLLAYADGFSLWHYRSEEPIDDGYFPADGEPLRHGDLIIATGNVRCGFYYLQTPRDGE